MQIDPRQALREHTIAHTRLCLVCGRFAKSSLSFLPFLASCRAGAACSLTSFGLGRPPRFGPQLSDVSTCSYEAQIQVRRASREPDIWQRLFAPYRLLFCFPQVSSLFSLVLVDFRPCYAKQHGGVLNQQNARPHSSAQSKQVFLCAAVLSRPCFPPFLVQCAM